MAKFSLNYTGWIIAINVAVFILAYIAGVFNSPDCSVGFCKYLALQPAAILAGKNLWTLLTSVFMHGSFAHLFVNMFSLFFIGTFVEKLIGKKRFLLFYIFAGIFASLFFAVLAGYFGFGILAKVFGTPETYGVGASGAIFGLLGLLAVLTPKNRVYLLIGPLIAIIFQIGFASLIPNVALNNILDVLINIYIVLSVFFILSPNPTKRKIAVPVSLEFWLLPIIAIVPLLIIGLFVDLPIGNIAHLGGLIAGLIYGFYLRKKYPKKTGLIARMFSR